MLSWSHIILKVSAGLFYAAQVWGQLPLKAEHINFHQMSISAQAPVPSIG